MNIPLRLDDLHKSRTAAHRAVVTNRFIRDSFHRTLSRKFSNETFTRIECTGRRVGGWASGQLDLHFKGTGVDLSGGCRAGDMAQIQHLWVGDVPAEAQTHGGSWKNTDYFDEQMLHKQVFIKLGHFSNVLDDCRFAFADNQGAKNRMHSAQQRICISCWKSLADAESIHFLVWNTSAWTVSVK